MTKYKVGVVTFFDAYNYGAVLQTFALQKFLNDNDISSCIVKHEWQPKERINSLSGLLYNVKYHKQVKQKKKNFQAFLSKCNFTTSGNTDGFKNECERFIVGSDQVWNSKWNYNRNIFFLTFTDEKYSYAASFGSVDGIKKYRHKLIKDDLSSFNAVSVREKSAVVYLEKLGIKAHTNIDPVFLLNSDTWEEYCDEPITNDKYILVYSLENNENLYSFARELASKNPCKVLLIADTKKKKLHGMDVVRYPSPSEFLSLFKNATAVVTNSFHGTAFSVVFNKPLYCFLQTKEGAPNDRVVDLLNDCGLSNRIVNESFKDEITSFDAANSFIENERKRSLEYLKDISDGELVSSNAGNKDNQKTKYYYAKSNAKEDVLGSRSGGIAYLVGKDVINNNGVVYGAILDENNSVVIKRIVDINDLEKTRNSKYVASDPTDTFKECADDLKAGKEVFYSALPCQINALVTYLKHNEINTDKLITADIVCHGAPKEKFFKAYIGYLEKKYHGKVTSFNFRDKAYGWDTHFESFIIKGKKRKSRKYTQFFYSNYGLKDGCFNCPFTNFERASDITLCDAWGYIKPEDKKSGANLVLINTQKGQELLSKLQSEILAEEIDRLETIQPNLMHPSEKPEKLDDFNANLQEKSFIEIYKFASKDIKKQERKNKRKARLVALLRFFKIRK